MNTRTVDIKLESSQDDKGIWSSVCPFCEWEAKGSLHGFCKTQMVQHLNEQHRDGKIGNA